ncbi:MAG: hypothetical protein ACOYMN_01345, partial [Roseimicrobium sp.]
MMNFAEWMPYVWLLTLCLLPVLWALLLAIWPRRVVDYGPMNQGNPMSAVGIPDHVPPVLQPLLQLTRTQSDADLRALIIGLRHMPIAQTAPILRRYLHSRDPELQLFSQSILQEKQDVLLRDFSRMQALATEQAPANLASFLEAGVSLMDSPLTPESEHPGILHKLLPKAELV